MHGNRGTGKGVKFLRGLIGHQGDACVPWPMSSDRRTGRGHLGYLGKHYYAHRLMCELSYGPAPTDEHEAAHNCGKGHEGCVNPKHLFWKTPSGNQQDRKKHGTAGNGRGPCSLTPEQVAEIKLLKGKKTQGEIGAMYGVHWTSIGNIFRGVTWAKEKQRRRRAA